MALSNFYLTDRGNALMAQTLSGGTISITKAQIGEGIWPDGTTFANVAALTAPIKDLIVSRKRADSNGQTIITVQFSTEGIGRAFNWSEFALWAADPASPDDRTQDFILGTSRALTEEEAVHFDAIQEDFNFNVILKTASADSVEIIFEGGAVYLTKEDLDEELKSYIPTSEKGVPGGVAALDAYGGLAIRQVEDNGAAHFFKNHSETVDYGTEVRDIDKDGNIAGISFNAAQQTIKAKFSKGGSTSVFDLLHRGIPDLSGSIGGLMDYDLIGNSADFDILEWASNRKYSGTFMVGNNSSGLPRKSVFQGLLCVAQSDKFMLIWDATGAYFIATNTTQFTTDWKEIPTTDKNIVLNVSNNRGYRIRNTTTGQASDFMAGGGYSVMRIMDTFDDNNNYREIMLVGAKESPDKANAVRLLNVVGGVGTSYNLYHEGNAPAVTATAELI